MAQLKNSEIRTIEDFVAYPNGRGYVLLFSDRTMHEFFDEEFGVNIYQEKYAERGTSKRNYLISFCLQEPSGLVARVLNALARERKAIVARQNEGRSPDGLEDKLEAITERLDRADDRIELSVLEPQSVDRTLNELLSDLRRTLEANKPEAAMDRLHTYCMKKIAALLIARGIECDRDEALHARFGKYRRILVREHKLQEISDIAMKSAISLFDRFNHIRNEHSFAHDNDILGHDEARYIFDNIAAILRLVRALDTENYDASGTSV